MTIMATMAIKGAFILGSESRQVIGGESWRKSFQEKDYSNKNFRIHPSEFPKTFLLGERYGLNYSGFGFTDTWRFEDTLEELQQMAHSNKYTFYELAICLNDKLKHALNGQSFEFHLVGFPEGRPVLGECNDGELLFYEGKERNTAMDRLVMAGMVDIIEKLCTGELLDYERMTIERAVNFLYLTITAGCKYLEYFTKYPEVSGGPINILVITPDKCEFYKFPEFNVFHKGGVLS
ncbi:MAG: hypothetical protein A4E52_01445 [Pelotomaculum sp. PtaB.Bin013]|uniref:Uncharacterized protein n=1 Tax=Pelotomaculum isophthalicicum JI TaxID=947010 RepID=A0A9X4JVV9_9FIRM|nr:hypothetical protein [Pelotomaculum isophthalicicum]MDF9409056.1 hypothetical protein [Pelotomaculum isophthalicicum JI]OPX87019.1 MAG: hypothetical protein A4E52_01445 [Pelotomaculum sp. PtaB.Bin013]